MPFDRRKQPLIVQKTKEDAAKLAKRVKAFVDNHLARDNFLKKAIEGLDPEDEDYKKQLRDVKKEREETLPKVTAPSEIIGTVTGAGKTTSVLKEFEKIGLGVSYYGGTHDKLDEIQEENPGFIKELARNADAPDRHYKDLEKDFSKEMKASIQWWRENDAQGEPRKKGTKPAHVFPACVFPRQTQALGHYGLPIRSVICEGCPMFGKCAYYAQETELQEAVDQNKTVLRTHQRVLAGSLVDAGPIRIIDEAFLPSITKAYEIPPIEYETSMWALLGASMGNVASTMVAEIINAVRDRPELPLTLTDAASVKTVLKKLRKVKEKARKRLQARRSGLMKRINNRGFAWLAPVEALLKQAQFCIEKGLPLQSARITDDGALAFVEVCQPDIDQDVAVIILDATAESEIIRRVFPRRRFEQEEHEADHGLDILHVVMPASNALVNNPFVLDMIDRQNRAWGLKGKPVVFSNKKCQRALDAEATFGAVRGLNSFKERTSAVIYGQAMRSHVDFEMVAGALNMLGATMAAPLETWEREDDTSPLMELDADGLYFHPDPLTHAVYRQQTVAEIMQAAGRLRAIWHNERPRVVVYGRHDISFFGKSLLARSYGMAKLPRSKAEQYFESEMLDKNWCALHPYAFTAWMMGRKVTKGMLAEQEVQSSIRKIVNPNFAELKKLNSREHRISFAYYENVVENRPSACRPLYTIYKNKHFVSLEKHTLSRSGKFFEDKDLRRKIDQKSIYLKYDRISGSSTSAFAIQKDLKSKGYAINHELPERFHQTVMTQVVDAKEVASKRFYGLKPGKVQPMAMLRMPMEWNSINSMAVDSLEDVQAYLAKTIHPATGAAVIRGAVEETQTNAARRGVRSGGKILDAPQQVLCLDVDGYKLPDYLDVVEDYHAIAHALPRAMGEPFASAQCLVSFSASCGMRSRDVVKAHLWFWLDRPLSTAQVRQLVKDQCDDLNQTSARFGQVTIDMSTLTEVHMIFEGPPVLYNGAVDPMPERMVMVPGGELDIVTNRKPSPVLDYVPMNEDEQEAAPKAAPRPGRATREAWLEALAKIGPEGFHGPVLHAVGVAYRILRKGMGDQAEMHQELAAAVYAADPGGRTQEYIDDEASEHNFQRLLDWFDADQV